MGRGNDVREFQQRIIPGERFGPENVQSHAAQVTLGERIVKRPIVDESTARCVDQTGATGHGLQGASVEQPSGLPHKPNA